VTVARPSMLASTSVNVTATQAAFEVASDALQMFGGYGPSREYPMEELFRDARSLLVADGNNESGRSESARLSTRRRGTARSRRPCPG
jgi:alkylation response protein AidB-like acyl-CoA dehydrogenase